MLGSGSGRAMGLAVDYLTVSLPGVSVFFGQQVLDGVFKASGDTRTPMRMAILSNALLLVLDPVLIFGLLGAPRLGVTGSAIALVAARSVALGVTWVLYRRGPLRAKAVAGRSRRRRWRERRRRSGRQSRSCARGGRSPPTSSPGWAPRRWWSASSPGSARVRSRRTER